jgi:thiol:disulfide interchange protein DsbD
MLIWFHFFEREVFLTIWIAIFFGTLAFYLFGKITLPHDSPLTHIFSGKTIVWITGSELYYLFNPWTMGSAFKIN